MADADASVSEQHVGTASVIGATPTSREDGPSAASGNRCISVGHKTRVNQLHPFALASGRDVHLHESIGYNHIMWSTREGALISVENVAYSPDQRG